MEHLAVEQHLAGLRTALEAFLRSAHEAGLEAKVPTCPAWTVRALLAHQGMVHRWARANLLGQECHPPTWNAEGQGVEDPFGWLAEGAAELASTIETVPEDVRAMVFLKDAPPPRVFWARRQCHETTIHAVDALAARLRRFPGADDAGWIEEEVALDGIDELLTGFVTRGRSRFAGAGPRSVRVQPGGVRGWTVEIDADGSVRTTRDAGRGGTEAALLTGSASGLYLALWNRAAPGTVEDPGEVLALWRRRARVRWS